LRLGAAEQCKSLGTFALNQGAQCFADQGCFLGNTGQSLGFGEQIIIENKGGAHGCLLCRHAFKIASFDAYLNALKEQRLELIEAAPFRALASAFSKKAAYDYHLWLMSEIFTLPQSKAKQSKAKY
jgi:hypothetical protein